MNKRFIYILTTALLFMVMTTRFYFTDDRSPATSKAPLITNDQSKTILLSDVCSDCSVVGGTEEASDILDLHNGTTSPRVTGTGPASPDRTHNRFIAPSKSQEIAVSEDARSMYLVNFSNGKDALLYTAPSGSGVGSVIWAGYEHVLYFGQGPVSSDIFPQVSVQDIFSYDLSTGKIAKKLSISQLGNGIENVVIFGVSTDEKKIVLAYGQDSLKYSLWNITNNKSTPLNINGAPTITFVPPSADGLEVDSRFIGSLMWIENSTLHIIQLGDLEEIVLPLRDMAPGQGLPPVSEPSPAGHLVTYLQQYSQGNQRLILLDILTGQERILLEHTNIDASFINSVRWTPDETKIVFPKAWNDGLPEYEAVSADPNNPWSSPKGIVDPMMPKGYIIEGFFYKR